MGMNKFRSLKVIDLFQPLFEKVHIDYPIMRKMIAVKLTMDSRRVPTIFNNTKKQSGNQFLKSLGIYVLYSLILLFFLFGDAYMMQMSILFSIVMFLLMSVMIADFSSVLLDVRDKMILGTKPVNARTVNMAKLIHVMIYMSLLTLAFTLVPIMVMFFVQGIRFTLLFIALMVLLVLFIIALTSLVYIFVLRFFSGEQLKNMINYIQILLSVGVIIGYQLVLRSFDVVDLTMNYTFHWWHMLLPPVWFASPFSLFLGENYKAGIIVMAVLAVIIPFIAITIYYYLMPTFEQNLQKLMETSSNRKKPKWQLKDVWISLFCWGALDKSYFLFAHAVVSREREFKLKVYPLLGMAVVFPFIFIFSQLDSSSLAEIGQGKSYFYMYFINIVIGSMVIMFQFSSKYKGAWIYAVTGSVDSRKMYKAVIKVFLLKFYIPLFIFSSIVFLSIFSSKIWLDLLIMLAASIIQTLLAYMITVKSTYPFSEPFESMQKGGNTAFTFLLMFLTLPFILVHVLSVFIPYGKVGYFWLLLITLVVGWRFVFREKASS